MLHGKIWKQLQPIFTAIAGLCGFFCVSNVKGRSFPLSVPLFGVESFVNLGEMMYREIFVFSYRLIYRVEDNRISILSLIHGARDFKNASDQRDRDISHKEIHEP